MNARHAWSAIALGVVTYDVLCPKGETLSEGVDRALEKYPALTTIAIGAVALHLLNVLPPEIDPIHRIANLKS